MLRVAFLVCAVFACGGRARSSTAPSTVQPPSTAPPTVPTSCLADELERPGHLDPTNHIETTCGDQGGACQRSCDAGDAHACMQLAVTVQQTDVDASLAIFARACVAGLAIGCTNVGAHLWLAHQPASDAHADCARRLFERACEVREPHGCGMAGRMRAVAARTPADQAAAHTYFAGVCAELGGLTCRMYAFHVETGDLGATDPAAVQALMQRACDTGDPRACGHTTAAPTFR